MRKLFNTYESYVMVVNDEQSLIKAIDKMLSAGQEILDIQSPHYIHIKNFNENNKPARYGIISGICGAIGLALISFLIYYVMNNPQLLFGNKGILSIMVYIPVLFTVSILFSGLGLLLAFSIKNHLFPGQQNQIIDKLASSEHYILVIKKSISPEEFDNLIRDINFTNFYVYKFIKQNIRLPLPLKLK